MGCQGEPDTAPIMSSNPARGDHQPTVLVVDDERGLADLYEIWLSSDYDLRVAYDGESAIEQLDETVDVVLLDRQMPDLTGDEVLEVIKEKEMNCRVAMVTAVDPNFDIVAMGFDDYVQKPVDKEKLREVVTGLLDRSDYDNIVEAYYTAVRKRALLRDRKDATTLAESDEFEELEVQIEELKAKMDDVTSRFDDDDFDSLFMELDDSR